MGRNKETWDDLKREIKDTWARCYWSEDSLTASGDIPYVKSISTKELVKRIDAIVGRAPVRWSRKDDKMLETALWHLSYSISNGQSIDIRCDTTEWAKGLKKRLLGDTSPVRMREVLQTILDKHVGRDGSGNRVAIFGEDVISMIEDALSVQTCAKKKRCG